jgi:hypothetical protein
LFLLVAEDNATSRQVLNFGLAWKGRDITAFRTLPATGLFSDSAPNNPTQVGLHPKDKEQTTT